MNVLGITDGITCGAAVVVDGRIVSAVNEERLSRLKMAYGFPRGSIVESLRLAGIESSDLDLVAVDTVNNYLYDGLRPFDGWFQQDKGFIRDTVFAAVSTFGPWVQNLPLFERAYYKFRWPVFARRRARIRAVLRREFGFTAPVRFVDHHLAHATSAYYTSGFTNATVVTMDGGGDGASSHIYWVNDGCFRRVGYTSAYNSIGNYYAYVTHLCGFTAQKHEGKITGLAAHGKPIYRDLLNKFIAYANGEIVNTGEVIFRGALKALGKALPAGWTREDLAASIQTHCEDIAAAYTRDRINPDGDGNLAIAGGVFANVRINQKLYELDGVERIFVHPGMTDAGLAVGAALAPCMKIGATPEMERDPDVIRTVFLGSEFSDDQIERQLSKEGVAFVRPESLEAEIARLLAAGHVVARFDGRMEYGPRALGNRSILYHPADPSVNDWLNGALHRTEFMPFAPVTLIEQVEKCYHNVAGALDTARFMTITFDCTDWMKEHCPGVVHLDGTARPQVIDRRDNPRYYRIVEEFYKLTGVPSIINTSFNMHEEPIVHTPHDAIRAFKLGHLDYLAIGGFLARSPVLTKRELIPMKRAAAAVGSTNDGGMCG